MTLRELFTPALHEAIRKIAESRGTNISMIFNEGVHDLLLIVSDNFNDVPPSLPDELVELFINIKNERVELPEDLIEWIQS